MMQMFPIIAAAARRRASDGGDPDDWLFSDDCEYTDPTAAETAEWTISGSAAFDTSNAIRGTRSLLIPSGSSVATTPPWAAQSELWIFCEFNISDLGAAANLLTLRGAGSDGGVIQVRTTGAIRVANLGANLDSAATKVITGTSYNLWVRYKQQTVANNGIIEVYLSDSGTSRGTALLSSIARTAPSTVDSFRVGGGAIFRMDSIRVSASAIGDNPLGL